MRNLDSSYTVVFTLGALNALRGLSADHRELVQRGAEELALAADGGEVAPPRPGEAPLRASFRTGGLRVDYEIRRFDRSLRVTRIDPDGLASNEG